MNLVQLGNVVKDVRENVLHMSQKELAVELNTKQNLLSRFETGMASGSLMLLIDFINLLNNKGYRGYMILYEQFDIQLLVNESSSTVDQIIELTKETQQGINESFRSLLAHLSSL